MDDDDFAELFKKLPSRPSSGTSWHDVAAEFQALGKTLGTPEAEQARDQFVRLTESIRAAAERAGDELRPELVTLLRQASASVR